MANFIPRLKDGSNVKRYRNGIVKEVITEHEGIRIPFVFKDGIAVRAKAVKPDEQNVSGRQFALMKRQAQAVYRDSLKKNPALYRSIYRKSWSRNERERLEAMKNYHCFVMPDGNMIITRLENDRQMEANYGDIEAAIRAQSHILEKYSAMPVNSELDRLQSCCEALLEAQELFRFWKDSSPEQIEQSQRSLAAAEDDLKRCRVELKVMAREKIKSIRSMKDVTGRINVGAMAARTTASIRLVEGRRCSIRDITLFVAARQMVLMFEKRQMEYNIAHAIIKLRAMLNSSDAFFRNRNALHIRINQALFLLQSVWLEPYRSGCAQARISLELAKKDNPGTYLGHAMMSLASIFNKIEDFGKKP